MMRIFSSHRVLLAALCCVLAWPGGEAQAAVRNPKGVAVIVGNADYEHRDIPDVSFAHRDADAFRRYVVDILGFDPENIIDLRDARRRRMFDALGGRRSPQGELWSYLRPGRWFGRGGVLFGPRRSGVEGHARLPATSGRESARGGRRRLSDRPTLPQPGESQGSALCGCVRGRVFFGEQRRGEPDALGESGLCARGAAEGTIEEGDGADGGDVASSWPRGTIARVTGLFTHHLLERPIRQGRCGQEREV